MPLIISKRKNRLEKVHRICAEQNSQKWCAEFFFLVQNSDNPSHVGHAPPLFEVDCGRDAVFCPPHFFGGRHFCTNATSVPRHVQKFHFWHWQYSKFYKQADRNYDTFVKAGAVLLCWMQLPWQCGCELWDCLAARCLLEYCFWPKPNVHCEAKNCTILFL